MLFDLEEAIKIRNHYYDILVDQLFSPNNNLKTTGIMISKAEELVKNIELYLNSGGNDLLPLLPATNNKEKEYKIYVIAYDGADMWYSELDNKLDELGIPKIY